jgi:hypothetical protein
MTPEVLHYRLNDLTEALNRLQLSVQCHPDSLHDDAIGFLTQQMRAAALPICKAAGLDNPMRNLRHGDAVDRVLVTALIRRLISLQSLHPDSVGKTTRADEQQLIDATVQISNTAAGMHPIGKGGPA